MNMDEAGQNSPVAGQAATAATLATGGGDRSLIDIAHDVALNTLEIAQLEHGSSAVATDAAVRILELAAAELRGTAGCA